jgi:hypothetical protein
MNRTTSVAGSLPTALLLFLVASCNADLVSISFNDGSSGETIGSFYESSGIVFENAAWAGTTPSIFIVDLSGPWMPTKENPLKGLFTTIVDYVSITAFDVGFNGARMDVYDSTSGGSPLYSAEIPPCTSGSTTATLTAEVPGIRRFELYQPYTNNMEWVGWDNLKFNPILGEPPVANAGEDQIVAAGDIVYLNGTGSWDPDDDPLSFSWDFESIPEGSLAEIVDPTAETTSFLADMVGTYEVSLVVNDGTLDSDPDTVIVEAIHPKDAAQETLIILREVIAELPVESLKNKNSSNALINKIDATLAMIEEGLYGEALDKLENDILRKTDGCAETGAPDRNDWIVTCDEQEEVYLLVLRTIELLARLIP